MLAMIIIIIKENHVTFRDKVSFWRSVGSVAQSTFKEAESFGAPCKEEGEPAENDPEVEECLGVWDFPKDKGWVWLN